MLLERRLGQDGEDVIRVAFSPAPSALQPHSMLGRYERSTPEHSVADLYEKQALIKIMPGVVRIHA